MARVDIGVDMPWTGKNKIKNKRPHQVRLGGEIPSLTAAAQSFPALRTGQLKPGVIAAARTGVGVSVGNDKVKHGLSGHSLWSFRWGRAHANQLSQM